MSDHSIIGNLLLWRKIIESEIWAKPPLYIKVWIWLLCEARYLPDNGLKRGQCLISIDEIREKNSYMVGYRKETPTRKQVWEILEWMRKTSNKEYSDNSRARNPHEADAKGYNEGNMIETTKVTHGLVVTICNYDKYQDKTRREGNNEKPHEGNNEAEAKRTEGEQYNKKEGSNPENTLLSGDESPDGKPGTDDEKKKPKKIAYTEEDMRLARLLYDYMLQNNPEMKPKSEKKLQDWANEVRLMREQDKRTYAGIEYLINFTQKDAFWKTNILSMDKLREQFDSLVVKVKALKEKQSPPSVVEPKKIYIDTDPE